MSYRADSSQVCCIERSYSMFEVILIYFTLLGMLHWTQEESVDPEKVSADPHQEEGPGAHQPQVHRHDLQVRSRKVPDPRREGRVHGTSEEGQEGVDLLWNCIRSIQK